MERILLCKPKMSGRELDFIKAALAEDWAVPLIIDSIDPITEEYMFFISSRSR